MSADIATGTALARLDMAGIEPPDKAAQKRSGAAKDFEALLIGQMLKSVREENEDDPSNDAAMGLGEEEFAKAISAAGGLGLAKTIEAGLR